MATPNIDMIAASLRSCSIGGGAAPSAATPPFPSSRGRGLAGGLAVADSPVKGDITVELNSDVALPYEWEQCLNLKTGQIYYRNRTTGEKAMEDPRKFVYLSEEDEDDDDGDEADDEDDGSASDDGDDSSDDDAAVDSDEFGNCSSAFSSSSSASSWDTIEWDGAGRGPGVGTGSVLVAAGCRVCMMYVMIPKRVERCPRCGGHVLHFPLGGGR